MNCNFDIYNYYLYFELNISEVVVQDIAPNNKT